MDDLGVVGVFSGIGGLELGLEKSGGFKTLCQIENEPYCLEVLSKNWPSVHRYTDVSTIAELIAEMSSWAASLARTPAMPDDAPAFPGPVQASGNGWLVPFAWYDRASRLWRTWQGSLSGGWEPFSGTWPKAGMTRSGVAFQLVSSERHIHVKGCSFYPTPKKSDADGGGCKNYGRDRKRITGHSVNLRDVVGGRPNPRWLEWLMGFPEGWTKLGDLAMQRFRTGRKKSAA